MFVSLGGALTTHFVFSIVSFRVGEWFLLFQRDISVYQCSDGVFGPLVLGLHSNSIV